MTVSQPTRVGLFALSGNECAFPGCGQALLVEGAIVGEICHIRGQQPGSARHDPAFSEKVDTPENLLVLCSIHHKVVDTLPDEYPVDRLQQMKLEHERSAARTDPASEMMEALTALLTRAAVPDDWWDRPGAPRFRYQAASTRPREGGAWSFEATLEQVAGTDVGQLRAGFCWEIGGEPALPEPRLERDREWRLARLDFDPVAGGGLLLRAEFWWDGARRYVAWRWASAEKYQSADVQQSHGDA